MESGAAFGDILDEKLTESPEFAGWANPSCPPRFVPPHPFLFATPLRPFRPSGYRAAHTDTGRGTQRSSTRPAPPPASAARPLTVRQRLALAAFVDLGAALTSSYTPSELRRAFRLLALAYHPDRHPGSSVAEQARLTRILADVNEHHRHLLAALQPNTL